MTIINAIKVVLQNHKEGLTPKEIYDFIIEKEMYSFGAESPISVVNGMIRKHCRGLDFPTACNKKYFKIIRTENKINYYGLLLEDDEPDNSEEKIISESNDMLPEEKIINAYQEHLKLMKERLIDMILANDPSFFEKMVVDLLLKMGYGYDRDSGIVTGKPHDGGIDGIIKEDKLGLDSIYVQAKRYKPQNSVKGSEIQQFIGAMGKVNKGVFITTSSFTKSAVKNAKEAYKTVQLIDGNHLAELMLIYEAGITVKKNIMIYQIDEDYFN